MNFLGFFRFLLRESSFDREQFSKTQEPESDDNQTAIMNALKSIESNPQGREAWLSNKAKSHEEVLTKNKALLSKKGIEIDSLQKLGQGAGGIAYDIGNNKVFKVTEDSNEAKVNTLLQNKTVPGIVQVFDVWKFPNSRMYGIILEKVIPFNKWPNDKIKSSIEEVVDTFGLKRLIQKTKGNWDEIWGIISQEPFAENSKEDLKTALNIFQQISANLMNIGISNYFDIHLDNIDKRSNGEIVIFDIGFAEGGNEPKTLNEFIRWLDRQNKSRYTQGK